MTKLIPITWIEISDNFGDISYVKIIFMVAHKTRVQVKPFENVPPRHRSSEPVSYY